MTAATSSNGARYKHRANLPLEIEGYALTPHALVL
jgi:hypothetical protein